MQPITYTWSRSNRLHDAVSLGSFALFLFPFLITVGIGLHWLEIPGTGWIKGYGENESLLFWLFFGTTVLSGLLFVFILRKPPVRNNLTLDDVGLTCNFMSTRRTWSWRDLEPAEVRHMLFGWYGARLNVRGEFGWKVRIGAVLMNGLASANWLAVMLPNSYEAPIEEIVARINEYRERALGGEQHKTAAAVTVPQATIDSGKPVTYTLSDTDYSRELRQQYFALAFFGLALAFQGYLLSLSGHAPWSDPWWTEEASHLRLLALTVCVFVVSVALVFKTYRANKPQINSLQLDGAGLTYLRRGKRHSWPWKGLSAFDHRSATHGTQLNRRHIITFTAPGKDWTWRWVRLSYGLPKTPPAVVIEDTYGTPLDEIAATLSAYREHALGGGNMTDGPRAPEQT